MLVFTKRHLRQHRGWWTFFLVSLVGSSLLYWFVGVRATPEGAFGGTKPGLWFGIVGTIAMLAAAFLAVRHKYPVAWWIKGNARFWLNVHLFVGSLSFVLILMHSGFRFGGPFEQVLMWCYVVVIVTGFYGLAVQHFIPRMMTDRVPAETFSQQVPVLNRRLLVEADWLTAEATTEAASRFPLGKSVGDEDVEPVFEELKTYFKEYPEQDTFKGAGIKKVDDFVGFVYESPAGDGEEPATAPPPELPRDEMSERLRAFYVDVVRPYLEGHAPHSPLATKAKAEIQFDSLQSPLPPKLRRAAMEIEQICDVRRQFEFQKRLLWWLHSWLYLHVPASMVLLVLLVVHVVMALMVVPPERPW